MKLTKIVIIAGTSAALFIAQPASGGPFGLQMGVKLEELSNYKLEDTGDYFFTTRRLPKNHSAFLLYGLVIHPQTGLCAIRAMGKPIESSSYGFELRAAFDRLVSQLKNSYGDPDIRDFLQPGSIWTDPDDFLAGLRKGERVLQAVWGGVNGPGVKDNIEEILLTADSNRHDEGHFVLQYRFSNWSVCDQLIEGEKGDAL